MYVHPGGVRRQIGLEAISYVFVIEAMAKNAHRPSKGAHNGTKLPGREGEELVDFGGRRASPTADISRQLSSD